MLIDNRLDINAIDKNGNNIGHIISEQNKMDINILTLLVNNDLDINAINKNGETIAYIHCVNNKIIN